MGQVGLAPAETELSELVWGEWGCAGSLAILWVQPYNLAVLYRVSTLSPSTSGSKKI